MIIIIIIIILLLWSYFIVTIIVIINIVIIVIIVIIIIIIMSNHNCYPLLPQVQSLFCIVIKVFLKGWEIQNNSPLELNISLYLLVSSPWKYM